MEKKIPNDIHSFSEQRTFLQILWDCAVIVVSHLISFNPEVANFLIDGTRDHSLAEARSELMKQEYKV